MDRHVDSPLELFHVKFGNCTASVMVEAVFVVQILRRRDVSDTFMTSETGRIFTNTTLVPCLWIIFRVIKMLDTSLNLLDLTFKLVRCLSPAFVDYHLAV
jgi:hypothetical protein